MSIDYDIVIIGGSLTGRFAALTAAQLRATVALVEPCVSINYGFAEHQAVRGLLRTTDTSEEIADYTELIVSNIANYNSLSDLAARGVDVIVGKGEFEGLADLSFQVNQRHLRSRTYLLAPSSSPTIPEITGLQTVGYLTLTNLWQHIRKKKLLHKWVIIGGVPQSLEVAQTLARLGCDVTLVVKSVCILSHGDPEVFRLLQAQLESENIRIFTGEQVTQVQLIDNQKWVQVGNHAIRTDEILVATAQQADITSLNLAGVGVRWRRGGLVVNNQLQTTNRRIYACGDVIGGYDFINVGNYEAEVAVNNALFCSRISVNYRCVPWGLCCEPPVAEVGLTEAQARGFHQVLVLRQHYKSVAIAQLEDKTTGLFKLIVLPNGKILGASILGAQAHELINLIALAISQNIPVQRLGNLFGVYPSFCEILENIVKEWRRERLNRNRWLRDFLEGFFKWRRNWNV